MFRMHFTFWPDVFMSDNVNSNYCAYSHHILCFYNIICCESQWTKILFSIYYHVLLACRFIKTIYVLSLQYDTSSIFVTSKHEKEKYWHRYRFFITSNEKYIPNISQNDIIKITRKNHSINVFTISTYHLSFSHSIRCEISR